MYLGFATATGSGPIDQALPVGLAFEAGPISGEGNSVTITNQPGQYWVAGGWKAVLGFTTKDNTLWWSLASQNGDPIAPGEFNVTSSAGPNIDVCGNVTDYVPAVKTCPDNGVTLTFNLCSNNQ